MKGCGIQLVGNIRISVPYIAFHFTPTYLRRWQSKLIKLREPINFNSSKTSTNPQMADQSSSSPILCASFNQDNSCFAIGTKDGFKIFDTGTGRLCYERAIGAFAIVEMLYSSSLLAIVGAGEQPSLSPRRLCLFNTTTGTALRELNFLTSIVAVRMSKKRLIVVLQEKIFVYDINSLKILDTVDTVLNLKGLCAFSPNLDACFMAIPASTTRGSVLLYNVMELQSHCEIDAHRAPLAAMNLSSSGIYIATASEQGTIIRVHLVSDATKSYSFRRGTIASTIYSLSFGPSKELPAVLVATSCSGSVHAFSIGFGSFSRSKKPSRFLGSIIPESVTDALDPDYHDVLQNATPAGIKSHAVIQKVDQVTESSISDVVACRATICVLNYNGHFQEYQLNIKNRNKFSWNLDREFNLLTAVSDSSMSS